MALRRGFKAEAERVAHGVRGRVGLGPTDLFEPIKVAGMLGVEVVAGDELIGRAPFEELAEIQADAFSACTFRPTPHRSVIVYNPLNGPARRNSDVTHELAHVLLEHKLSQVQQVGGLSFFVCDARQEEEAGWLSGCLLLPRELLLGELKARRTEKTIASRYAVSEAMVTYRINVTGVRAQLDRSRARRA